MDKICFGLIMMQAKQKEAMHIDNEQMGAIYQQHSEQKIDHKASSKRFKELTVRPMRNPML